MCTGSSLNDLCELCLIGLMQNHQNAMLIKALQYLFLYSSKKTAESSAPFPTLHKAPNENHLPGFFIVFPKDLVTPVCKLPVSSQGTWVNPLDHLNTA